MRVWAIRLLQLLDLLLELRGFRELRAQSRLRDGGLLFTVESSGICWGLSQDLSIDPRLKNAFKIKL